MYWERRRRRSIFEIIDEYLEELERASREFMGALLSGRPSWDTSERCLEPLTNMHITPDEVVVTVDLPMVKPETIKVRALSDNVLEVSAEMKRTVYFREFGVTHHRGEFCGFKSKTRIPVPVDMRNITTKFVRGILEIHIPRKAKAGVRIPVE